MRSTSLKIVTVLLLASMTGCSKQAPAPQLSIANEKATETLPAEPPQMIKDLWAEANPLPDWTNLEKGGKTEHAEKSSKESDGSNSEKLLQKLEQLERRLAAMERDNGAKPSEGKDSLQQTKHALETYHQTFDAIKSTRYGGVLDQDAKLGVKVTVTPDPEDLD